MINTKKRKLSKGFTLIEVMISLFLSVMVAFFVYTMMMSSYNAYKRLSSLSKNANSIRFFIESFNNSIRYATNINPTASYPNDLVFERYAINPANPNGPKVRIWERYYFDGGGTFKKNQTNVLTDNNYYKGNLGLLKKSVILVDENRVVEIVVISNIIRNVYYQEQNIAADKYKRLDVGVIYDDVVNGKQNVTTGKLTAGVGTEMDEDTINRRQFCFAFRSR